MAAQILRAEKLKTVGNVSGSLQHMLRENGKAPNADLERTALNQNSVRSSREAMQKFEALEPDYKQKNNVEAIEFLVTASPDFFLNESPMQWQSYLNDGLAWIEEKIGAENIVATSFQMDETSPHLSVIARPIVERRFKGGHVKTALSAKRYLDGSHLLSKMQDDFHDKVASDYGLERGTKGSLATHRQIQSWYGDSAGGAARIRELEKEYERFKERMKKEREEYFEKLKSLYEEIEKLRSKGGRWRKRAQEVSFDWFKADVKKSKSAEALIDLKTEVERSDILPRGAINTLSKVIEEKIKLLTPEATQTRKRGR